MPQVFVELSEKELERIAFLASLDGSSVEEFMADALSVGLCIKDIDDLSSDIYQQPYIETKFKQ